MTDLIIKYINHEINNKNYKDYFEEVNIVGDGNCGVYSIIYAMNICTHLQKYKTKNPIKFNGSIMYDTETVTQFRKELSDIYEEKEKDAAGHMKEQYKKRKIQIQKNNEWLEDQDIQLYGEKHELCIVVFQHNEFQFISNGRDDWYGFDNCINKIFLINHGANRLSGTNIEIHQGSSGGTHFQVLVPKKNAPIYKNVLFGNKGIVYFDDKPQYIGNAYANDVNSSASNSSSRRIRESGPVDQLIPAAVPAVQLSEFDFLANLDQSVRNLGSPAAASRSRRNKPAKAEAVAGRSRRNKPAVAPAPVPAVRNRQGNARPKRSDEPSVNLLLGSLSVLIMITIISLQ